METERSIEQNLRENAQQDFIARLESEYKRVIDALQDHYKQQTPQRQQALESLDEAWWEYVRAGASGQPPAEFLRFARSVVPDAFPAEVLSPPSDDDVVRFAAMAKPLLEALAERASGRNEDCWPVCDFGGKDADLDPEGCTGIKRLVNVSDETVVLQVGGHKTLGDPTYESEFDLSEDDDHYYSTMAHETVAGAGFAGEWPGDDWTLTTSETVSVPWVRGPGGDIDYEATADAVVTAAEDSLASYREEMRMADEMIESLYQEIRKRYEPSGE